VLPYSQLFEPNAVGTAELIRIALSSRIKPFAYVSTIGVGAGIEPGKFVEDGDIRVISPTRVADDSYANGYGNSKWAGEVLLREAHDLCGLPVSVFRCDMILADTGYAGQLNLPDMFTRMMLSVVATGIAPGSFYERGPDGERARAHYDGLPVEFIAEAISTLGERVAVESGGAFSTYHVMNPYDDSIGMDEFIDWLIQAGYRIERVPGYLDWLNRFETALRALPDRQRQASLLPLLHNYQHPQVALRGSMAPTDRFRAAVQDAKIGPDKDIPHITRENHRQVRHRFGTARTAVDRTVIAGGSPDTRRRGSVPRRGSRSAAAHPRPCCGSRRPSGSNRRTRPGRRPGSRRTG
jgi:fatty acid CoA ligase FadD9